MKMDFRHAGESDRAGMGESIRRQLDGWLGDALADEQPPQGLAADLVSAIEDRTPLPPIEGNCDLYTLWSAVTALTQEVKLQSRTFKQVSDKLAELPEAVAKALDRQSSEPQEDETETRQASPPERSGPWKEQIDLLLDLRDRFERGLNSVREAGSGLARLPGWRRWFAGRRAEQENYAQVLSALEKGYTLTLERLDQALADYHVSPIDSEGKPFDCRRMAALDSEETDSVPDGTVVAVYRAGYEWQGEVFRPAQVRVARRKVTDG